MIEGEIFSVLSNHHKEGVHKRKKLRIKKIKKKTDSNSNNQSQNSKANTKSKSKSSSNSSISSSNNSKPKSPSNPKSKSIISEEGFPPINYLFKPISESKHFKRLNFSNTNDILESILISDSSRQNYNEIKPVFKNQEDVEEKHRKILIDWLINLHMYFKLSDECLYLTIKIIDTFLARIKNFSKSKIQLLGICALQLSSKFIEKVHPSIDELELLCDKAFTHEEIVTFEKFLLKTIDYFIEQDLVLNFFDIMALKCRFNNIQYLFGKMLLDLTLLDVNFYQYQKKDLVFSVCFLVFNNDIWNFVKENFHNFTLANNNNSNNEVIFDSKSKIENTVNQSSNLDWINFLFSNYSSRDFSPIFKCTQEILGIYENIRSTKINSAIQKFFIQIKELKEDYPSENVEDKLEEENTMVIDS